jgi:hypothetical protein
MLSGPFPPQFEEPVREGSPKNPALLPCGIGYPHHAFDCAAGFPD